MVGATANHSLFLAVHEVTHGLAFKNMHYNRYLAMIANLPITIAYSVTFKPYHMQHHRYQARAMRREGTARGVLSEALWCALEET